MNCNFVSERVEESIRTQLHASFGEALKGRASVRWHHDVPTALNEAVRGLARLFPHKKSLAVVQGSGPWYDPLAVFMATEGYQTQEIPFASVVQDSAWVSSLSKDCLMVIHGVDDLFTGRSLISAGSLNALQEKKVFSVAVSCASHAGHPPEEILSHQLRILAVGSADFGASEAILAMGDRCAKIDPLIVGPRVVPPHVVNAVQKSFSTPRQNRSGIEAFEKKGWGGAKALLPAHDGRVWDRAVFYWDDVDGSAVVEASAAKLGWTLSDPGMEKRIESASLCRWGGLSGTKWLAEQGYSPNTLRGLVIVDGAFADEKTGRAIESAVADIRKLMG